MDITKYQAKKHFTWGSLTLEPHHYLLVEKSSYLEVYRITSEKTNESIFVDEKALENYVSLGFIQKV